MLAGADVELSSRVSDVARAKVWHATRRHFVVASRSDIEAVGVQACLVEARRGMVTLALVFGALAAKGMDKGVHGVGGVDGRLVDREESWSGGEVEDALQLESGERFVTELGKFYLDVDEV